MNTLKWVCTGLIVKHKQTTKIYKIKGEERGEGEEDSIARIIKVVNYNRTDKWKSLREFKEGKNLNKRNL